MNLTVNVNAGGAGGGGGLLGDLLRRFLRILGNTDNDGEFEITSPTFADEATPNLYAPGATIHVTVQVRANASASYEIQAFSHDDAGGSPQFEGKTLRPVPILSSVDPVSQTITVTTTPGCKKYLTINLCVVDGARRRVKCSRNVQVG